MNLIFPHRPAPNMSPTSSAFAPSLCGAAAGPRGAWRLSRIRGPPRPAGCGRSLLLLRRRGSAAPVPAGAAPPSAVAPPRASPGQGQERRGVTVVLWPGDDPRRGGGGGFLLASPTDGDSSRQLASPRPLTSPPLPSPHPRLFLHVAPRRASPRAAPSTRGRKHSCGRHPSLVRSETKIVLRLRCLRS